MTTLEAISAQAFTSTLGVNTHIDFDAYGYQDLATVEQSLDYLGVSNVRDSAADSSTLTSWLQVAQATGVKFDDYIPQGSVAAMQTALGLMPQLAQEGILNFVEGGDEEDDSLPALLGNSLDIAARFQQQVAAMGQQLGLPVINISFGAGWTSANNWQGDYGAVGDLSAYASYGNAHTYPNPGQAPDTAIQQLNALSLLADSSEPVITSEIGWDTNAISESSIARYVVDAAFDGIKDGDTKMYYYALFNDMSGNFGLMNADGTPTEAGTALHDLTTLLADTGVSGVAPGSLGVSLSGDVSTDNTLLIQKSDGSDWLALWDESADTHSVTVTLDTNAQQVLVFDPVTGTSPIAGASDTDSITVSLGQDPLLIEVVPADGATTAGGSPLATTAVMQGSGAGPVVSVPETLAVVADGDTPVAGVSVADAWAGQNPGTLSLTVRATGGTISMTSGGSDLAGSGTDTITVSGSLAGINADLSTLVYTDQGGPGSGAVDVDVWDQAGVEADRSFNVQAGPATTIDAGATTVREDASGSLMTATSGSHAITVTGSGDTVNATGGAETIQASAGFNTIVTGDFDDTIGFAGSNNVIDPGSGTNMLYDDGTNNTIVLSGAGEDDIYGNTLGNGDVFDLRTLLAQTAWDGRESTLGNFLSVGMDGSNGQLTVDPSGGGASHIAAVFEGSGQMDLSTLLAHAIA